MTRLKTQFLAGLIVLIPLTITLYGVWLLFLLLTRGFMPVIQAFPFLSELPLVAIRLISFVLTMAVIFIVGVLATNFGGRRAIQAFEAVLLKIPFIRGFYEASRLITESLLRDRAAYQRVVLVEYPHPGAYAIGFVTSIVGGDLWRSKESYASVFIPSIPNPTSGFLIYVPETKLIPLEISIEEGIKVLFSHGFIPLDRTQLAHTQLHQPPSHSGSGHKRSAHR